MHCVHGVSTDLCRMPNLTGSTVLEVLGDALCVSVCSRYLQSWELLDDVLYILGVTGL